VCVCVRVVAAALDGISVLGKISINQLKEEYLQSLCVVLRTYSLASFLPSTTHTAYHPLVSHRWPTLYGFSIFTGCRRFWFFGFPSAA
jgi:hypothetical protein